MRWEMTENNRNTVRWLKLMPKGSGGDFTSPLARSAVR